MGVKRMSIVPCDRCADTHHSRVVGTYPTIELDGQRHSRKLRLGDECLEELLEDRAAEWVDVSADRDEVVARAECKCGHVFDGHSDRCVFWFTAYVKGKYRHDYRGWYCRDCAHTMIDSLQLEVRNGRH